jgi:hypothetical protein
MMLLLQLPIKTSFHDRFLLSGVAGSMPLLLATRWVRSLSGLRGPGPVEFNQVLIHAQGDSR